MKKKSKRKYDKEREYLIGYSAKSDPAIYSDTAWRLPMGDGGAHLMTMRKATQFLKGYLLDSYDRSIFKIVQVKRFKRGEKVK